MLRKTAVLGVALAFSAAIGCARSGAPDPANLETQRGVAVAVDNDHWLDVTIYALRAGVEHRLGTVRGSTVDTIMVSDAVLGGAQSVRFLLEPIGSTSRHVTDNVIIPRNAVLDLNIRSPLNLTFLSVASR